MPSYYDPITAILDCTLLVVPSARKTLRMIFYESEWCFDSHTRHVCFVYCPHYTTRYDSRYFIFLNYAAFLFQHFSSIGPYIYTSTNDNWVKSLASTSSNNSRKMFGGASQTPFGSPSGGFGQSPAAPAFGSPAPAPFGQQAPATGGFGGGGGSSKFTNCIHMNYYDINFSSSWCWTRKIKHIYIWLLSFFSHQ